jgi:hypothetical protein
MVITGLGRFAVLFAALGVASVACGGEIDPASNEPPLPADGNLTPQWNKDTAPPMLGVHQTRDAHSAGGTGGRSPAMLNHGGAILPSTTTQAIFWGTSWSSYVGDKMTGLDSFYTGHGGSNFAKTVDEYSGTNGAVTAAGSYAGHVMDPTAAAGGGSTATILAEVCKLAAAGTITPQPDGSSYFPVYTDVVRGRANYCAWHSAGTCSGVTVQFAFFFQLDGDAGCDPKDTSGLHSQGLAALANVSGHELSEARSDPAGKTWFDASGNENADKCAWTFGAPLVTFSDGSQWKIQGNWSNAAYAAHNGYVNSSGQAGCLSGL